MQQGNFDIGLIGLGTMGQNLALNLRDNGYKVILYNRTLSVTKKFMKQVGSSPTIRGVDSIQELCQSLTKPKKILIMVQAGMAVDAVISQCMPFLEPEDIIIDGGNSHYIDSERRYKELREKNIFFVGAGISGGEEGARYGPSIMPGGDKRAWPYIAPYLQSISAKVEKTNEPCCDWVGEGGAGHYIKMVHNGIEYGDIQIICEAYHIMKEIVRLSSAELQHVFEVWNRGRLNSYLIEITSKIFAYEDTDGIALVEKIRDTAGQKGTGKWTGVSALELGVPVTLIVESVFARMISANKKERMILHKRYPHSEYSTIKNSKKILHRLEQALYVAKIISYAQGFMLMQSAAIEYNWKLNFATIGALWQNGCIIRSAFLAEIVTAFTKNPKLENLLLDDFFCEAIKTSIPGLREIVALNALEGIPTPCLSAALSFFDASTCINLPANLLQAQRDFFGAHTYQRIDKPEKEFFHTKW
ncbi:MAG: decarboxylating NADP(+)-dependent phosphogluconate dehydrogenase [Chlamydiales bacterium]